MMERAPLGRPLGPAGGEPADLHERRGELRRPLRTVADRGRVRQAFGLPGPERLEPAGRASNAEEIRSAAHQHAGEVVAGPLVLELVASLSKEFAIDSDRVYLVGQSLGGRGTWDLISKRPDLFAAAVPLCGDGSATRISKARAVPVWAFHGARDEVIPVTASRELVAALKAAGSSVKYTEYPDTGHNVWTRAFSEKDLAEWMFMQRRPKRH